MRIKYNVFDAKNVGGHVLGKRETREDERGVTKQYVVGKTFAPQEKATLKI